MQYRVVFTATARAEAIEVARFIKEESGPRAAAIWRSGLVSAIASLSVMPRRCPVAAERRGFPQRDLRQFLYFSHRLIFEIRDAEVLVLRVRHASQRPLLDI